MGSKTHIAVDTLGNTLTPQVTLSSEQDRARARDLTECVQQVTGGRVEVAFVDQGNTSDAAADKSRADAIRLEVVKGAEAKKGLSCCRALGRRAHVQVGGTLPAIGTRFCTLAGDIGRAALPDVRRAEA